MKRKKIEEMLNHSKESVIRFFKSPKKIFIAIGIWYIEAPIAIGINLHKNPIHLYTKPINTFIDFFHISVISGMIKFNIIIFLIFAALCYAMHLSKNDYEDGKILELKKILLIKDMMKGEEKSNINWSERGDYGTARWIENEKQVKDLKGIVNISNGNEKREKSGVILGYLRGTKKIITLQEDSFLNQNIAVFGSSGSMKSRSYIILNILNLMNSGESMIITDPKGGATRFYLKRVNTYPFMKEIA